MSEKSNEMISKPLVSFVVPVYNVEDSLRECLISVVFQTMAETEVIIVNDASPDNSQTIIDEFVAAFPDKVKTVCHEENQGLAMARRTGLMHASAPYVLFVDSDDFVSGQIAERLYQVIVDDDLDILYYPYLQVDLSTKRVERKDHSYKGDIQTFLIKNGIAGFQWAMYRTEFLKDNQDIAFIKGCFEDASATPMMISRTNRIGIYKKSALYYYRANRPGSITASVMTEQKMLDYQKADLIGWDVIPDELKEAYAFRTYKRAAVSIHKFPEIYDYTINHLKHVYEITKDYNLRLPSNWKSYANMALEKPDTISIPKIVYVNGFIKNNLYDFQAYVNEAEKAYLYHPETVVLDAENCDLNTLPASLKNAGAEDVGLYFALKAIAERGGIYLGPQVRMVTSFNKEAYNQAFFTAGANRQVLTCVFGAAPENPAILSMLRTIEKEDTVSVAQAMTNVLIAEYGAHLNGRDQRCMNKVHILATDRVCYSSTVSKNYCYLNYANLRNTGAEMISIPVSLNAMCWKMAPKAGNNAKNTKKSSSAQDELKKIKNSRAWGAVTRMYEYRDLLKNKTKGVRKLLKSIPKKMKER